MDYAARGSKNVYYAVGEFLAHYNTLTNKSLPPYQSNYATSFTGAAEGYYNVIPDDKKTPEIEAKYKNLGRFLNRTSACLKKKIQAGCPPNKNIKP